ncbi:unnamed protein product [Ostreobium quekettii]|uniref:Uncharacterized protein n=1 Tax=Ostreobium quekettii TaxID=121088 RepID=A0A8S1ITA8_9CHLO|nr:unnamed protein product [Ostreobium quekettii]
MVGGDGRTPIGNKPAVRVEYDNLCPESQWRLREALRIWADWHETKIAPQDCTTLPGPLVGGSFAYMWPAMYGGCVALMEVPKPTDAWAPVVMTSVSMQVQKDVIVTSACGPVAPSSAPQQLGQAQPVAQTVSTCEPPQEAVAGLKCVTKRGAVVVVSRAPVQGAQVHGEKQAQDRNAAATKAAKELKNDHQSKRQRQETAVAPVVKFKDGSSGQSMQAAQGVFVKVSVTCFKWSRAMLLILPYVKCCEH